MLFDTIGLILFVWCTVTTSANGAYVRKRDVSDLLRNSDSFHSARTSSRITNSYLPANQGPTNGYQSPSDTGSRSFPVEPALINGLASKSNFGETLPVTRQFGSPGFQNQLRLSGSGQYNNGQAPHSYENGQQLNPNRNGASTFQNHQPSYVTGENNGGQVESNKNGQGIQSYAVRNNNGGPLNPNQDSAGTQELGSRFNQVDGENQPFTNYLPSRESTRPQSSITNRFASHKTTSTGSEIQGNRNVDFVATSGQSLGGYSSPQNQEYNAYQNGRLSTGNLSNRFSSVQAESSPINGHNSNAPALSSLDSSELENDEGNAPDGNNEFVQPSQSGSTKQDESGQPIPNRFAPNNGYSSDKSSSATSGISSPGRDFNSFTPATTYGTPEGAITALSQRPSDATQLTSRYGAPLPQRQTYQNNNNNNQFPLGNNGYPSSNGQNGYNYKVSGTSSFQNRRPSSLENQQFNNPASLNNFGFSSGLAQTSPSTTSSTFVNGASGVRDESSNGIDKDEINPINSYAPAEDIDSESSVGKEPNHLSDNTETRFGVAPTEPATNLNLPNFSENKNFAAPSLTAARFGGGSGLPASSSNFNGYSYDRPSDNFNTPPQILPSSGFQGRPEKYSSPGFDGRYSEKNVGGAPERNSFQDVQRTSGGETLDGNGQVYAENGGYVY